VVPDPFPEAARENPDFHSDKSIPIAGRNLRKSIKPASIALYFVKIWHSFSRNCVIVHVISPD